MRNFVQMDFTWDASAANPQPGDQFQIQLPDHFENKEFPLEKPLEFGGETVGTCSLEQRTITCTLNEKIQGKTDIRGSGFATLKVVAAHNENTSTFTINGTGRVVNNPGNGPIGDLVIDPFDPKNFYKHGEPLASTADKIEWSVVFSGQSLQEAHNGQMPGSIVLHDVPGPGHAFLDDPSMARLAIGSTRQNPANWLIAAQADGTKDTALGDFTISYAAQPDGGVDVTVSGPFNIDHNYYVIYHTSPTTASGTIQQGFNYVNDVALVGTELTGSKTLAYVDSFSVTITMKDGFGSFKVAKLLSGDGASSLSADTEYTGLAR